MNEDNRIKCGECDEFLQDEEFTHTVNYGYWDSSNACLENGGTEKHYCRECWSEMSPMQRGVKYDVETPQELVNILKSSKGKLVADFNSQIIGNRVFMRITEDRTEFAYNSSRVVGENTVAFNSEYETESESHGLKFTKEVLFSGDLPPMVILVNKDSTPFENYPDLESDQSQIEEF